MHNKDLRAEFRIANVRQWESRWKPWASQKMTFVKWLRRELSEEKKTCPGSHREVMNGRTE